MTAQPQQSSNKGLGKFVRRTLLALTPLLVFALVYVVLDPFRVWHPYNGMLVMPGDSVERNPNERFIALEGYKFYNGQQHYDSFIFGSSISTTFLSGAWKRHLPDTARVYHFTAGSQTLSGIRDEVAYLLKHCPHFNHALIIMEEEILRRATRYEETPYVPHYEVSPAITRLHFHRVFFNAYRDPDFFLYSLMPRRMVNRLLADGKLSLARTHRSDILNEDYLIEEDSLAMNDPHQFYDVERDWLVNMTPRPTAQVQAIDETAEQTLRQIAALLQQGGVDYRIIVPPRYKNPSLTAVDHALLCEIMGADRVFDYSGDEELINDVYTYYDGAHLLTWRCTQLIDRSYTEPTFTTPW